jgi:hypothetical protein
MKTTLALMTLAMLLGGCGGRDAQRGGSQQAQYPTVQEGSANGVTSTINGPGETLPPITGTNADTTTNLALNPNAATASVAAMPPNVQSQAAGGSLAGTMSMTSTAAGVVPPLASHGTPMTAPVASAPRAGTPPVATTARRAAPAQSAPAAQPAPSDESATPAEPAEAGPSDGNMTSGAPAEAENAAPNPAPDKDKADKNKDKPQQPPSNDTTGTEQEEPPPPPPPPGY